MSVAVDNDYMKQDSHIKALHEYSHMNEESITKLKIISMGDLLANGVFDKVQGDTNKIVLAFCENIEKFHLKRSEMNFHVFYFLYQLFQYLKSSDDLSDTLSNLGSYRGKAKLIVFSKKSLDLGNFFTKILPDVMNNMKFFLTDSKIEDHFKKARLPEGILTPFKEKVSLVFLSILNAVTRDRIKFFVFNEPKKLILILNQLKELVGRISFVEPYALFFEKKKTQVYRKIIQFIIELFMDSDPSSFKPEYHQSVYQCRLMMLYLWNKLAKIKLDYKKTTRYQALVKDQLKVHKGKMLHIFK
jgi:predicted transcriptional regulator with HTH domain